MRQREQDGDAKDMPLHLPSRIRHAGRFLAPMLALLFPTAQAPGQSAVDLPDRVLVGYWHNFNSQAGFIKLREVSDDFDVINVSFAVAVSANNATMQFIPDAATSESEIKNDIAALQSRGKKVLISIGGANSPIHLTTATDAQIFVDSMIDIIEAYGFDGMDIDLEGTSLSLEEGDDDFTNPTTPLITNFIAATLAICDHFGSSFILTAAPETAFVQGGRSLYSGLWGAYLPVIHALRDRLTYLHVQHYNTGSMMALDDRIYEAATADFQVAMAEMLLQGFPILGDASNVFPPLREDQVAIGLPASMEAAGNGYTDPATIHQALDYLIRGMPFGGSYVLRQAEGYPNFRGLMTWSINWDRFNHFEFSTEHRAYLDALDETTDTQAERPALPMRFALAQNHPNPFSGSTVIRYELAREVFVTLTIYDALGQKVATLVQGRQPAGHYAVSLDAQGLPSGAYFCRIQAGTYTKTRNMILLKTL